MVPPRKTMSFNTFQHRTKKVAIVGVGNVGIAGAYAMYLQDTCQELLLVDIDKKRAEGEALDLQHGQGLTGRMVVNAVDYEGLHDVQVVVLTAGVAQKPGETRLSLLDRNAKIFRCIVAELDKHAPNAIIVVTSNPVDLMTYLVQEMTSRPTNRVIGTGTLLDSSRFRTLLGQHYEVDPRSVHGYILGEHGDSEVAAFSTVRIAGLPIKDKTVFDTHWEEEPMKNIAKEVVQAAYKIIEGKGYTNLAIGVCIATLVETILNDRHQILPVSVRLTGQYGLNDVCLSIPCRLTVSGLHLTIPRVTLY
eukprot:GHVN01022368.1.p1 GENE.GHVN01022368.1~~GHVN01022368.1.p1  ORF type:complete len:305 (+),score=33.95 GHVN01022368.1:394-1308(+)